jgi:hypothetical protein
MQLSENTIATLKNFSTINPNFLINPGNVIRTMAPDKSLLAEVIVDETFPVQYGIYDLPQFLGTLSILENPDIEFVADHKARITDSNVVVTYHGCSPALITSPPDKKLELSKVDASFRLTTASLQKILKLAAMNNLPMFTVEGTDEGLFVKVHEDTDTTNTVRMRIGDHSGAPFAVKFRVDNMRIQNKDYNVEVAFGSFATFETDDKKLKYYIALQTK